MFILKQEIINKEWRNDIYYYNINKAIRPVFLPRVL